VVRYGRSDFAEAAKEVLDAEDLAARTGEPYGGPRYAAFSVWRPIKTVRRDPLAVCVSESIVPEDFLPFDYRAPNLDSEYIIEAYAIKPPKDASKQRWYWLQEVLVIKLADSEAEMERSQAVQRMESPVSQELNAKSLGRASKLESWLSSSNRLFYCIYYMRLAMLWMLTS